MRHVEQFGALAVPPKNSVRLAATGLTALQYGVLAILNRRNGEPGIDQNNVCTENLIQDVLTSYSTVQVMETAKDRP